MQQEVTRFLEYLLEEKTKNTAAAYRNDLSQFLDFLSSYARPDGASIQEWGQVDESVIQEYLFYLRGKEYAPSTVARKIASVKSFFQFLRQQGRVNQDPTTNLASPKVKKNQPHIIDPAQVDQLLAAPAQDDSPKAIRDKALLEMLYATGMRVTELVNLDVEDVDLANAQVTCGTDAKHKRTVPIYPEAVRALERYLQESRPRLAAKNPEERALFLNHRGRRLTRQGLWLIIKEYVNELGIQGPVTPHTLRHSFASHMLRAGAGIKEVQARLGHASPTTTQVYQRTSYTAPSELVIDGEPVEPPSSETTLPISPDSG